MTAAIQTCLASVCCCQRFSRGEKKSPLNKIKTSPLAGVRTKMVGDRADEKPDASKKSGFFSALDAYENPGAGKRS
jgi:hypothetical protein